VEFMLGYNMQHPAHPQARRLKTHDPRVRNRYIKNLHKMLSDKDVYSKFAKLHETVKTGMLPSDIIEYERLDGIITHSMYEAERHCRKLKTGIVQWSHLYQKACDRVTYWLLMQKDALHQRVNRRKILSLRKKLGIRHGAASLQDIEVSLQTAIKIEKSVKNMLRNYSWGIGINWPRRKKQKIIFLQQPMSVTLLNKRIQEVCSVVLGIWKGN